MEEFLPAATLFFANHPDYMEKNIFSLLVEPERVITFRVPWVDDQGKVHVNTGYRVQFNSALGPYKGGLRFHPSVNVSILKFLAFEQTFKNSLTTLLMGGGKGGADFSPKGHSDLEIMRFCQSFMTELSRYIGDAVDVPAGDIGVSQREIGYLYGMYKKLRGPHLGTMTGKPLAYGGSLGRKAATGYGLIYFVDQMLQEKKDSWEKQIIHVSGSGNVAIYAIEKAQELGGKVVTCSDSDGFIYDKEGIDLALLKEIKEVKRKRLTEYQELKPEANYFSGNLWDFKKEFTMALPCATQNEINESHSRLFLQLGVKYVAEGANMPSSSQGVKTFLENNIYFAPGKAANAGGVAVSGLEMAQNSQKIMWYEKEVDDKLKEIMVDIFKNCQKTAQEYGEKDNLLLGANISSLEKVSEAMASQGII